jgi:hypothetical protein
VFYFFPVLSSKSYFVFFPHISLSSFPVAHERPSLLFISDNLRASFEHKSAILIQSQSQPTMAPIIQIPAEDTLKTLQNVLRRRNDNNKILKERKKKILSGEDYRLLRVDLNNTQFLQPLDAENTKASIYYIRQKFIRYVKSFIFVV